MDYYRPKISDEARELLPEYFQVVRDSHWGRFSGKPIQEIRTEFISICEAREDLHHDWRSAWEKFFNHRPANSTIRYTLRELGFQKVICHKDKTISAWMDCRTFHPRLESLISAAERSLENACVFGAIEVLGGSKGRYIALEIMFSTIDPPKQ